MENDTLKILREIDSYYDLPGKFSSYKAITTGHINDTYKVDYRNEDGTVDEYIFQRINGYVFKEPQKVMSNIKIVNQHIATKVAAKAAATKANQTDRIVGVINFFDNKQGENYILLDRDYWRVSPFIKNSVSFDTVEDPITLYSAGYAFGQFQHLLSDIPMEKLYETIPDFHNTKKRMDTLFSTVEDDPIGRAKDVKPEIDFFRENKEKAGRLVDLQEEGKLPLRVTHNDTKYNNILMDKDTLEPLCVIDLDTIMPGLSMYDFGDAIRYAGNTAVEDEKNLAKVGLSFENYEQFTKGFMEAANGAFTEAEIDNMALGAIIMTIETGARFLTDYIDGDKYFRIHRENHNLDRARCQIKLAQDMIHNYNRMVEIVKNYQ